MRVALLSDTKTISSCWTWYAIDIHFPFLTPHCQSRRVIRIRNNIKLLDLVWYWFYSAFLTSLINEGRLVSDTRTITICWTWYGALLSDTKTKSSCWTWYAIDILFPFLSPHCQSRRVIRIRNNIKLLDLVWYWFFSAFLTSPINEGRLVIRH